MKIKNVRAIPLNLPVPSGPYGRGQTSLMSVCLAQIETDTGLVGTGMTSITEEEVVATIINEIVAPALDGIDAICHERIWNKLYWLLTPRGQSGYASHAIAAIDLALWDIKGKALGLPGVSSFSVQ